MWEPKQTKVPRLPYKEEAPAPFSSFRLLPMGPDPVCFPRPWGGNRKVTHFLPWFEAQRLPFLTTSQREVSALLPRRHPQGVPRDGSPTLRRRLLGSQDECPTEALLKEGSTPAAPFRSLHGRPAAARPSATPCPSDPHSILTPPLHGRYRSEHYFANGVIPSKSHS